MVGLIKTNFMVFNTTHEGGLIETQTRVNRLTTIAVLPLSVGALHPHTNESHTTYREYKPAISVDNARILGMHPLRRLVRHTSTETSRSEQRKPLPKPTDIPPVGSVRELGHSMLLKAGFVEAEWPCLDELWSRESDWEPTASNGSSGAYGIPQALPAWKMETAGSDWRTNPITQIRWGLGYIRSDYGTPCAALSHSNEYGYY